MTSYQDCVDMVKAQRPTANGATVQTGGVGRCYAEIGMTGRDDNASWETTFFYVFVIGDGVGGTEEYLGEVNSYSLCV